MPVWQEGVCALIPAVRWLISTAVSRPQPGLLRSSMSLPLIALPICWLHFCISGLFLLKLTGSSLFLFPKAQLNLEAGK